MADRGEPVTKESATPLTKADIPQVVEVVVAALATTSHGESGKP